MGNIICLSPYKTYFKVFVDSKWIFVNIKNSANHGIDVESPSYAVNHLFATKFDRHLR